MKPSIFALLVLLVTFATAHGASPGALATRQGGSMDTDEATGRLKEHLRVLTVEIGERSVRLPDNLERAAAYIQGFFADLGLSVHRDAYRYEKIPVANIVARLALGPDPSRHYVVGAHYDTVSWTPGADDNGSAVAVLLELARRLRNLQGRDAPNVEVTFAAFTLEEPPAFRTASMGSRVYAKRARKRKEKIHGMICLEMVGYTCREPGCQHYPFPLGFMDYPETGDFIGIVGNWHSRKLTRSLDAAFQKNPHLPVVSLTVPGGDNLLPAIGLSDHSSFWREGYPAVMVTDTAFYRNPHYHLPSDTADRLDYRFMAQLVDSLVLFFESLER